MFIIKSARVLLINSENKILLFKFKFSEIQSKKVLWVTPGGRVEEGENFEQALKSEEFFTPHVANLLLKVITGNIPNCPINIY